MIQYCSTLCFCAVFCTKCFTDSFFQKATGVVCVVASCRVNLRCITSSCKPISEFSLTIVVSFKACFQKATTFFVLYRIVVANCRVNLIHCTTSYCKRIACNSCKQKLYSENRPLVLVEKLFLCFLLSILQFESAHSELSSESFQSCVDENEADRECFPDENRPFSLHTRFSVM